METVFNNKLSTTAGVLISLFFGLLLIVPGILLLVREFKKPIKEQVDNMKVLGYVFIFLGLMIALGFGKNLFF